MFAELNGQWRLDVELVTRSGSEDLLVPAAEWLEAPEGCCPNFSVQRPSWQAAGFQLPAEAQHSYTALPFGDK